MKEYGTVEVVVPDEWSFRVSPLHEARILAEKMGGTLTGEVEISRSDDFTDNASTYIYRVEREVEGS